MLTREKYLQKILSNHKTVIFQVPFGSKGERVLENAKRMYKSSKVEILDYKVAYFYMPVELFYKALNKGCPVCGGKWKMLATSYEEYLENPDLSLCPPGAYDVRGVNLMYGCSQCGYLIGLEGWD